MTGSLQNFARNARHSMTAAEERLWHFLRSNIALRKSHFRRQVILETYIVDFCCHAARLIVEVDGATHSTLQGILKDQRRTRYLESIGYHVLRVTNDDVFSDIESVMDTIYAALQATPHVISETEKTHWRKGVRTITETACPKNIPTPYPSPQGGGEENKQSSKMSDASPFPSPLEGEGQGGG